MKCLCLVATIYFLPASLVHGSTLVTQVDGSIEALECNASIIKLKQGSRLINTGSCVLHSKTKGKVILSYKDRNINLEFPGTFSLNKVQEAKWKQDKSSMLISQAAKSSSTIIILTSSGGTRSSGDNNPEKVNSNTRKKDRIKVYKTWLSRAKYTLLIEELKSPSNGEEYFFRGSAFYFLGDSSNAIADLERAVFLSGSLQQRNRAQVILNMINLEAGRFQQVLNDINAFKKLHRRKETAAEIYFQECLAALALNKKHRETGGFKELEKLYPNHPLLSML